MVGWNVFGNMWNDFSGKFTVPEALNPPQFDRPWNFRMFAAVRGLKMRLGRLGRRLWRLEWRFWLGKIGCGFSQVWNPK